MNLSEVRDKSAVIIELKAALKRAGLSQAWATERLGITPAHLSRILNKQAGASLDLVIRMKELATKVNSLKLDKAV